MFYIKYTSKFVEVLKNVLKMTATISEIMSMEEAHTICKCCEWQLLRFLSMTLNEDDLKSFILQHKLLPTSKSCPNCSVPMHFSYDQQYFRCHKRIDIRKKKMKKKVVTCNKQISVNQGTCFQYSHKARANICRFIAMWAILKPPRSEFFCQELEISQKTLIDWVNFMREVCIISVHDSSEILGGERKIVEFVRVKIEKKEFKRGRALIGEWVFGGFERNSDKIFAVAVTGQAAATMLAVIKDNILPGTTIVSDCWKLYKHQGDDLGFQDFADTHNYTFMNPENDGHTKDIEKIWKEVTHLPRYGNRKLHSRGDLCEFLFKLKYPSHLMRIHNTFTAIAKIYDGSPLPP